MPAAIASSFPKPQSFSRLSPRIMPTSMIQTIEIGIRTFQPNRMNWSYRNLGSVPRSQMKQKMRYLWFYSNGKN